MLSSLIEISGQRKSFQAFRIVSSAIVASAGRISGSRTRTNTPRRLQPSIIAASSISFGRRTKNWRIRKMLIAVAIQGRKSDGSVPTMPSAEYIL